MDKNELIEIIHTFKDDVIFYLFEDAEIAKIAPHFELIQYPAGVSVFTEGEPGDFVGFVVSGKLEVMKKTEFKGKQIIIALLGKGALVGELSVFDNLPRSATVVALTETTLIVLRENMINSFIEENPLIGVKLLKGLIRILSIRLRKSTERLTAIF